MRKIPPEKQLFPPRSASLAASRTRTPGPCFLRGESGDQPSVADTYDDDIELPYGRGPISHRDERTPSTCLDSSASRAAATPARRPKTAPAMRPEPPA